MKQNNIFRLKRFLGLIGTGIYKRKNSKVLTFTIWVGIFYLFILLEQLISNLEFDSARNVVTRVYQISYIIYLSIPVFRLTFNEQMSAQWNLLPASAFEKNLYSVLGMLIWRSLLFFIVVLGMDYMLWNSSPFIENMGMEIGRCRIRLTEFFTFGVSDTTMPRWASYVLAFFFYASIPILAGININTSLHREYAFTYAWTAYLVINTIFNYCIKGGKEYEYMFIVFACAGILGLIYNIIFSITRSCSTKA